MTTRVLLSLLGAVFAAATLTCNGSGLEAEGPTGTLVGLVTVGPFCPVEVEGQPCPPPPGTYESIRVLVYAQVGNGYQLVADTRPDSAGRFQLDLPAGSYRVALEHTIGIPGGPGPIQEARVDTGAITTVAFDIDTGIR